MGTDPGLPLAGDPTPPEEEAPGADRPGIDPAAPGQGVSYVLTSRPAPTLDRVDAGGAVTGTSDGRSGEAPPDADPGADSALEADDIARER